MLWSFAQPYRGTLLIGFALALAVSAMTLTSPMVTKWVLDTLALGGSLRDPILLLVGLLVLGVVVGWYQWVLLGGLAEDVVYDARERILRRYLGARVFALERRPGELVTRVTSDTVLLDEAASSSVIGLINGVIVLIGSLVLMARLDVPLFLTSLGAVAVIGVAMVPAGMPTTIASPAVSPRGEVDRRPSSWLTGSADHCGPAANSSGKAGSPNQASSADWSRPCPRPDPVTCRVSAPLRTSVVRPSAGTGDAWSSAVIVASSSATMRSSPSRASSPTVGC